MPPAEFFNQWEETFSWYTGILEEYRNLVKTYDNKDPLSSGLLHDILVLKYVQENMFGWRKDYRTKGEKKLVEFYEDVVNRTVLTRPKMKVYGRNYKNGKKHEYDLIATRESGNEKFLIVMEFKKRKNKKKKARGQIEKRKLKETYRQFLSGKIKGVFFMVGYSNFSKKTNEVRPHELGGFTEGLVGYKWIVN